MKKTLITIGVLALVGAAIAGVVHYNKNKTASDKDSGMATKDQFDKFVEGIKKTGGDIFDGATADQMKKYSDKWQANLTRFDGDSLITLSGKKEKDWTPSEKVNFMLLFKKFMGK